MVGVTMPSYPTRVLPERHFSPTTFLLGAQLPGLPTFQVGEPGQETYQVSNEYISWVTLEKKCVQFCKVSLTVKLNSAT